MDLQTPGRTRMAARRAAALAAIALSFLAAVWPAPAPAPPSLVDFWRHPPAPRPSFAEWSSPRGGEAVVLPPKVVAAIALLREHKVQRYFWSEAVERGSDEGLRQRLAEGVYPIVLDRASHFRIGFASEKLPPACRWVETRQDMALAACE